MSMHDELRIQITKCLEHFLNEVIGSSRDVAIAMETSAPFFVNLILILFQYRKAEPVERDYRAMAKALYEKLAALPDAEGNAGSFLPVAVCCDFIGVIRFERTLEGILRAILTEKGDEEAYGLETEKVTLP